MKERRIIINHCPPGHLGFALEAVRYGLDEMPHHDAIFSRRGVGSFYIKRTETAVSVYFETDQRLAHSGEKA